MASVVIATILILGIVGAQAAMVAAMLGWNPLQEGHAEYHEKFYWSDSHGVHEADTIPNDGTHPCNIPVTHGLRCLIHDVQP